MVGDLPKPQLRKGAYKLFTSAGTLDVVEAHLDLCLVYDIRASGVSNSR